MEMEAPFDGLLLNSTRVHIYKNPCIWAKRQFTRMLYQVIFRLMSLLCDLFVCAQHLDGYHKKAK